MPEAACIDFWSSSVVRAFTFPNALVSPDSRHAYFPSRQRLAVLPVLTNQT